MGRALSWASLVGLLTLGCGESSGSTPGLGTVADPAQIVTLGEHGRARDYDVLLVTLDTVRADHLGCYGYPHGTTPHIDDLARTGVTFSDVTAPAPLTLPSHATMMTGRSLPSHGVRNNGTFRLAAEQVTLAERLRDAGYMTGAFVGSFVLDGRYGLDQGFASYDDDTNPDGEPAESGLYHERNARHVTDVALKWLRRQADDARLFTWVHYFDAHRPFEAPASHRGRHPGRAYDAEIAFVDEQLGRLVEWLRSSGRLERTLVVVTADHGEGLGEHGEQSHSLFIYESTLHVPLVLSCPTLFDRDWVVDDRVAGLVDLAPTVLSLLGLPQEDAADGRPLLSSPPDPGRAIYIESMVPLLNYGWAPLTGLRRHGDKYIHAPDPEYYRLDERPLEQRNRWGGTADGGAALADALLARTGRWGEFDGSEEPLDPDVAAALAALGYVRSSYRSEGPLKNPRDMIGVWNAISQAEMISQRGDHAGALSSIRRVVQKDPLDGRAWHAMALIHRRAEQWPQAEQALLRSVELTPNVDAYVLLAQLQLQRGALDAFEGTVDTVRDLDPGNGEIEIAVGDRLALQGRFAEALCAFQRALASDPVRAGPMARQKIAAAEQRLR